MLLNNLLHFIFLRKKISAQINYFKKKKLARVYTSTLCYSCFEKGCRKNVHTTIPKGNMGYDQYTASDTVTFEPAFVAFF